MTCHQNPGPGDHIVFERNVKGKPGKLKFKDVFERKALRRIMGMASENSYQELKRSQKDRHTKTHGNCIEIFRLAQSSFSIERE